MLPALKLESAPDIFLAREVLAKLALYWLYLSIADGMSTAWV